MAISRNKYKPIDFQTSGFGTALYHPWLRTDIDITFSGGEPTGHIDTETTYQRLFFNVNPWEVQLTNDGNGNLSITVGGNSMVVDNFEDGTEVQVVNGFDVTGDAEDGSITANSFTPVTVFLETLIYANGSFDNVRDGATMYGTSGNDSIVGFDTNDVTGRTYDDILIGGEGNDTLRGGDGFDTYHFNYLTDGHDHVYETDSTNNLALSRFSDWWFVRAGQDLLMNFGSQTFVTSSIRFDDFFDGSLEDANRNNDFGIVTYQEILLADLRSDRILFTGTSNAETMRGTSGNDGFDGLAGDDNFYLGLGNDEVHFAQGDGADDIYATDTGNRLVIDASLGRGDMAMQRSLNDLILDFGNGDSVFLDGFFTGFVETADRANSFGAITFENGDAAIDLTSDMLFFQGTSATEDFYGTIAADMFRGNGGDDDFTGGLGDDIYRFGLDAGAARIYESDSNNTIQFDSVIDQFRLAFTREGFDMVINVVSGGSIRIDNYFDGLTQTAGRDADFGRIVFDGGSPTIDLTTATLHLQGTTASEDLYGTKDADILEAAQGDDDVFGGTGADIYKMDRFHGNDRIYEEDTTNTLSLTSLFTSSQITFERSGFDLKVNLGFGTSVLIDHYFDSLSESADRDQSFGRISFDNGQADIDLTSGVLTLQGTAGNEDIYGTVNADIILGLAGDDDLRAGDGNDQLVGGLGADTQIGGAGNDLFVFETVADSAAGAADLITDFTSGADRLDLSAIDAIDGVAGSDFTAIGTNTFTGTAGQLRYEQSGLMTSVYGDTDGDEIADLEITLTGLITLTGGDVIL